MSASLLEFRPEASHWEPKFPFDLVVAYEDETSRNRALALSDHLAADLRDDHDLQSSWWRLDFLQHPQLLERAVDAAVNANMILLSLQQPNELPPAARAWLNSWVERKDGHNAALVALVEGPGGRRENCPVLGQLHSAARQAQMSFFSHVFPPSGPPASVATLARRETTMTALLQNILRHRSGAQHWGINE